MRGRIGDMIPATALRGIFLMIGGLVNILFADEYVRYVTSFYSARTLRFTGWVAIAVAIVLIAASFWAKVSQELFS